MTTTPKAAVELIRKAIDDLARETIEAGTLESLVQTCLFDSDEVSSALDGGSSPMLIEAATALLVHYIAEKLGVLVPEDPFEHTQLYDDLVCSTEYVITGE